MSYLTYYSKPQLNSIINSVFPEVFNQSNYYSKEIDFSETDSDYVLTLDLPGFDKKEIELSTENHFLGIEAKNDTRSFSKSYDISNLDYESVDAQLNNGVLTLTFQKSETTAKQLIKLS